MSTESVQYLLNQAGIEDSCQIFYDFSITGTSSLVAKYPSNYDPSGLLFGSSLNSGSAISQNGFISMPSSEFDYKNSTFLLDFTREGSQDGILLGCLENSGDRLNGFNFGVTDTNHLFFECANSGNMESKISSFQLSKRNICALKISNDSVSFSYFCPSNQEISPIVESWDLSQLSCVNPPSGSQWVLGGSREFYKSSNEQDETFSGYFSNFLYFNEVLDNQVLKEVCSGFYCDLSSGDSSIGNGLVNLISGYDLVPVYRNQSVVDTGLFFNGFESGKQIYTSLVSGISGFYDVGDIYYQIENDGFLEKLVACESGYGFTGFGIYNSDLNSFLNGFLEELVFADSGNVYVTYDSGLEPIYAFSVSYVDSPNEYIENLINNGYTTQYSTDNIISGYDLTLVSGIFNSSGSQNIKTITIDSGIILETCKNAVSYINTNFEDSGFEWLIKNTDSGFIESEFSDMNINELGIFSPTFKDWNIQARHSNQKIFPYLSGLILAEGHLVSIPSGYVNINSIDSGDFYMTGARISTDYQNTVFDDFLYDCVDSGSGEILDFYTELISAPPFIYPVYINGTTQEQLSGSSIFYNGLKLSLNQTLGYNAYSSGQIRLRFPTASGSKLYATDYYREYDSILSPEVSSDYIIEETSLLWISGKKINKTLEHFSGLSRINNTPYEITGFENILEL